MKELDNKRLAEEAKIAEEKYSNPPNQEHLDRQVLRLKYLKALKSRRGLKAALAAWAAHLHIPRTKKAI